MIAVVIFSICTHTNNDDLERKRESMGVVEFLTTGESFGGVCITGDRGDNKLTSGEGSGNPYYSSLGGAKKIIVRKDFKGEGNVMVIGESFLGIFVI